MRNSMKKLLFATLFLSSALHASTSFVDSVKKFKWGDLDVVWIEDNKFPKFTASVYFHEGALNDTFPGVTQAAFDQMSSGSSRENQREISEFFDFYGANLKHNVTHEYSIFTVQALTKDIEPVMGKVCELFRDAQYPESELKSYISRSKSHLKNLVTSHAGLADRIFRKLSLEGTPYEQPAEGTLASFERLSPTILKERLGELKHSRKVLYLAGPSDVKNMEKILTTNCGWKNESELKPQIISKPQPQSYIYLVSVPGANQAQIRIGRYLVKREVENKYDQFQFLAGFMGGSFTSKLVQELRVKRGLTYSAGAYISIQRDYGRAGIITFSKNETAADAIGIVRDVFSDVSAGKITEKEFSHQQGHEIGSYAFGFEETSAFLGQLMLYGHQNRPLSDLANFPEHMAKLTAKELAESNFEVFPWEKMTIVVVGDKSLEKSLSKIRPVKVLNFQDFL